MARRAPLPSGEQRLQAAGRAKCVPPAIMPAPIHVSQARRAGCGTTYGAAVPAASSYRSPAARTRHARPSPSSWPRPKARPRACPRVDWAKLHTLLAARRVPLRACFPAGAGVDASSRGLHVPAGHARRGRRPPAGHRGRQAHRWCAIDSLPFWRALAHFCGLVYTRVQGAYACTVCTSCPTHASARAPRP